jgi:hypothetical protein
MSRVSVVCCQVVVSALGCSRLQKSPTECGVSECDCETSILRRPWPTSGCCTVGENIIFKNDTVITTVILLHLMCNVLVS